MLQLNELSIDLISNINLHVKPGEIVGIVGNNGSGKTTLAKYIAGF